MKSFYITTAIDYANGSPHVGHAYEKVLTDVVARFRRLMGDDVYFLTGLDEHGQKVQQSAQKRGIEPIELCDEAAEAFKGLCQSLDISNDDFIRTTEERHKDVVRTLLQKLYDEGEIYKSEYKGYYSARAEQFLQEKDKVDGEWPEIFGEVTEITESNYFFKLSKYQDWLIEHIKTHDDFIFPRFRAKQVMEFLKEPINDLCISRPKERLEWGIPLPFDEDFVAYVWFDALINYISGVGYGTEEFDKYWPVDYHVIGKDILLPPHSVYWPIMLKACGIALPKSLLVHGWWLSSGEKMSKSTGTAINPLDMIDQFGTDAFRYFVIREMNVGQDSNFSFELFMSRYNSDLANDLGNLLNRILNMTARYTEGQIPACETEGDLEKELWTLWENTGDKVIGLYEDFQFHTGLDKTFAFISSINRYVEQTAPWKLAKSEAEDDQKKLRTSLYVMAEALRLAVGLLEPVTPGVTEKVYALLGYESSQTWKERLQRSDALTGRSVGEKTILFPKPQAEGK
ncbi:methionine--tRNA ligase [Puniceicoccaceae bacterium K14]|nr:methionine--tRNA ligase [Puniceicoccaceae bacterium K14]